MAKRKEAEKKWTIMVYLAGDNNLEQNGTIDIGEMKKVGSTPDINIVAQFDRAGKGSNTNRYYLRKGTALNADVVESLGEINTGDAPTLIDFIKWGIEEYPAKHYMLVLWNHGQGWDDTDIYAGERSSDLLRPRSGRVGHALFRTSIEHAAKLSAGNGLIARAILLDDNAKDFLDNIEMKQVVESAKKLLGRKLDILGMDACLMSMAEVAYQMRDCIQYTVGSEETEPLDGWPYSTILSSLAKQPGMSPDALCKIVVRNYIASYKGGSDAVTQSAFNLAASSETAAAVKKLATALKDGLADRPTLITIADARNRVQDYDVEDNVDLIDLCRLLQKASIPANIKDACKNVVESVTGKDGLVISSGYYGAPMKQSNGIAIYFPTRSISPLYARLDFVKKTGWGNFLKAYIKSTRER